MNRESGGYSRILDLALISFAALFFEILLIRWVPSCVQVMAYFTNAILISSFLGFGLGCLLADVQYDLMWIFLPTLLGYVATLLGFSHIPIDSAFSQQEHFLGKLGGEINPLLVVSTVFVLNTAAMVPIGQRLGIALRSFRPLIAYALNIGGSIAGVALFACLSYGMTPPYQWFLCGLIVCFWFFRAGWKMFVFQMLPCAMIILLVLQISPRSLWSPYYKVDISVAYEQGEARTIPSFYTVSANDVFHQRIYDLSKEGIERHPSLKQQRDVYEYPYGLVRPQSVMIIGAGSGNDAAAALRMGARKVVAVEIDPLIASLGSYLHPEKPYKSDRVTVEVNDGRSVLEGSDSRFDLITFGYLDSHRVFSQFSSVRLDNFIYTEESFRAVKKRLAPRGMMSLIFFAFKPWVVERLYASVANVFGKELVVVRTSTYGDGDTVIFLAGPAVSGLTNIEKENFRIDHELTPGPFSTKDDWPFLYLLNRGIPHHYLLVGGFVVLVALFSIFLTGLSPFGRFEPHFFFLGAGFMLLETVSITRFALLFGSTWTVNVAVIVAILAMILLSTIYVEKGRRVNVRSAYLLLGAALLLNLVISPSVFLSLDRTVGVIIASAGLALPILFAAIIFASSFMTVSNVTHVFAYNLFGAIIGGVCEYVSMATGFRFLYVLAIAMYVLSFVTLRKSVAVPQG